LPRYWAEFPWGSQIFLDNQGVDILEQAVTFFHGHGVEPFGLEFEHGPLDEVGNFVSRKQPLCPERAEEEDDYCVTR
jgi:hypothetical protein